MRFDIFSELPQKFTHAQCQAQARAINNCRFNRYFEGCNTYTDIVEVVILEHDFYWYGWELTKTNTITFGKYHEERAKAMMRTYIGVHISLGLPINQIKLQIPELDLEAIDQVIVLEVKK